jgi:hypothetical protein
MPSEIDIMVTSLDSADVKLVAEVKLRLKDTAVAERQLKDRMLQLSCPVGLIITPETMSIYSDQYKSTKPESIEKVGQFPIGNLLDFRPSRAGIAEASSDALYFETFVQSWLENLPQTATPEHVNNSEFWRVLNIYVLPAIENGQVRAAAPRYR